MNNQIKKIIKFNVPTDKVWHVWIDFESTPEWVDGVSLSRITSDFKEGAGVTWREKCKVGGFDVQVDHIIREWDPNKRVAVDSALPMGGKTNRVIEFKENKGQAEVNLVLSWDLGVAGGFFSNEQMYDMMDRSLDRTATKWKQKAER